MVRGKEAMLPRVASVETGADYNLLLTFTNGEKKCYDVKPLFDLPVYKDVPEIFNAARVEFGTVVWPGDIDVSPDSLYLNSIPV